MTIEQKTQRYNEALERAKKLYEQGTITEILSYVFPELKESEDERIRKYLISFVKLNSGVNLPPEDAEQILAWLEKQGKQKPTDKLEPKFHEGEWIVWKDKCYKVNYNGCGYELVDQDGLRTSLEYGTIDENAHLWDVTTDAKDGDMLCYKDEISLYKHDIKNCTKQETTFGGFVYHCCYDGKRFIMDSLYSLTEQDKIDIHPATKEQCDTLMKAIADARYTFDFDKKVLKKIKQEPTDNDIKEALRTEYEKGRADAIAEMQKPVDCIDCTNSKGCINCEDGNMKETLVQKTAWSEEDEEELDIAVSTLKEAGQHDSAKWLKSLKDRRTWEPSDEEMKTLLRTEYEKGMADAIAEMQVAWSEEDEKILNEIFSVAARASLRKSTLFGKSYDYIKWQNWLKSLKERIEG